MKLPSWRRKNVAQLKMQRAKNAVHVHEQKSEPWRVTLVDTGEETLTGGRLKRVGAYIAGDEAFCAWENFIGDVQLAHAELIKQPGVIPYATALLGHSEGGLFAIAAASLTTRQPPYALVLAATPGLKLHDIIRNQFERSSPHLVAAAEQVMNDIRRTGHAPADMPRELAAVFPSYIGPFLKGELAFDPAAALATLTQPCLLIHGGADRQIVPMAEIQPLVDALAGRTARGEVAVVPQVSHNLKQMRGADDPGFGGPLAPDVAAKLGLSSRQQGGGREAGVDGGNPDMDLPVMLNLLDIH